MAISSEEITTLSQFIFSISGIYLEPSKGYLLETRLKPLLVTHGCDSYMALHHRATADGSGKIANALLEAMTTNETYFFRDNVPFELLRNKILPDLVDARSRQRQGGRIPLRIWSAASSTGQEAYSIAITLRELLPNLENFDIYILGTDISDKVVAQASYGRYNKFEVERGLDAQLRQKYFVAQGDEWRIRDELRVMVQFKKFNLMQPFDSLGGRFDIIFCRNVAIYFNHGDKMRLFQKMSKVLQPDGVLIVGGSETLSTIAPDFEVKRYLRGVFYQLKGRSAVAATAVAPSVPPQAAAIAPKVVPRTPQLGGVLARVVETAPVSGVVAKTLRQPPHPDVAPLKVQKTPLVAQVTENRANQEKPPLPPAMAVSLLSALGKKQQEGRDGGQAAAAPLLSPQKGPAVNRRSFQEQLASQQPRHPKESAAAESVADCSGGSLLERVAQRGKQPKKK
ncbi:MAG: methyltransferase domain-containing protein [Gammaproteobacteria bacterium]|nr:methyltransferase domain-containing protein [Gammaproteobacteria bacterium]